MCECFILCRVYKRVCVYVYVYNTACVSEYNVCEARDSYFLDALHDDDGQQ